ncbi:MAG: fluoride efflux transporter CrcB [Alphaproteobacteria bacterium]|nr:fluoride efflux transporter CrcB [Alphaproteobacteria bacterium]
MRLLLAIALGGALGSVARYLLGGQIGQWLGAGFPWGTLGVNVLGGLAMGVIAAALGQNSAPELRAFLTVGVMGGFTTFSAFAFDVVALVERGAGVLAAVYIGASVALAVLGLALGMAAVRALAG